MHRLRKRLGRRTAGQPVAIDRVDRFEDERNLERVSGTQDPSPDRCAPSELVHEDVRSVGMLSLG